MQAFDFITPQVSLIILLVFIAGWAAFLVWRWRATSAFADELFAAKQAHGELAADVTLDDFRDIYVRCEGPRASTYFFVTALAVMLVMPPVIGAFSWVWHEIWLAGSQRAAVERGTMVHAFACFLMAMAVMVAFLALSMRRYHKTAPPTLNAALRALNGPDFAAQQEQKARRKL